MHRDADLIGKNAAELTHYLKETIGNGSMKNGVMKLIESQKNNEKLISMLNDSAEKGKIKNITIASLSMLSICLIGKILKDTKEKNRKKKNYFEIEKAKEALNSLEEKEVEKLIEETLKQEEKGQNK